LWSNLPANHKKVVKQPYPEKKEYPDPVKVTVAELTIGGIENIETPNFEERIIPQVSEEREPIQDMTGKKEYDLLYDTLKILIPPSKYSWRGSGYWSYPNGKRYWDIYQKEMYREWVITDQGLDNKLNNSFGKAKAQNYLDKKKVLGGYVGIIKLLPEEKRLKGIEYLIDNVADNPTRDSVLYASISEVVKKVDPSNDIDYIDVLSRFGKYNPNDGIPFISYIASIINKFDKTQHSAIIESFLSCYYQVFDQNFAKQKDATDFYIPLAAQLRPDQQSGLLYNYYRIYLKKNLLRDNEIDKIELEYQQAVNRIDNRFLEDQMNAQNEFEAKKVEKEKIRFRSLTGIGGGIVLIVLIATFLAFLSIQRSVRKMERKMGVSPNQKE
jgi:hypothetical protein